jgi:16S rRNA processing protein RimM
MADDPHATWPEDALEVGRIGEAWGLKGDFRVLAYVDPPQALLATSRWHLRPAEAGRRPTATMQTIPATLEISRVRASGDGLVASSPAVPDRSAAEALRGARIFVARSQFPSPGPDEFYWADLIGLTVVDRTGQTVGSVVGLIDTGPQSVLRIQRPDAAGEELLIPFVSAYVDSVDVAARRIVVDWGADY